MLKFSHRTFWGWKAFSEKVIWGLLSHFKWRIWGVFLIHQIDIMYQSGFTKISWTFINGYNLLYQPRCQLSNEVFCFIFNQVDPFDPTKLRIYLMYCGLFIFSWLYSLALFPFWRWFCVVDFFRIKFWGFERFAISSYFLSLSDSWTCFKLFPCSVNLFLWLILLWFLKLLWFLL